jgi:purine-binding chemotaxis protein CheW
MPEAGHPHRADPHKNLVGFVVGDVHYALDIRRVREILNPLPITPLPHTPAEVAGVADHRGEVVPLIDLRARFGLPRADVARGTKWILVRAGARTVGLIVDGVTEVFGTGGEDLRPTPEVGGRRDVRGIAGVATHAGRLTFVLESARFIEIADSLAAAGALSEAPR